MNAIRTGRAVPRAQRVLLATNQDEVVTPGKLFRTLADRLDRLDGVEAEYLALELPRGSKAKVLRLLRPRLANIRAFFRADVICLHSAVAFTAAYAFFGRLLGKRVVVFLWDVFPEPLIEMGLVRDTFATRLLGWLERRVLGSASAVYVPTQDYLSAQQIARLRRVSVLPMWPYLDAGTMPPPLAAEPLRVGFAGSINPIRDFPGAVAELARAAGGPVELHVWSADPAEGFELPANVTLAHHGFVGQEELTRALAGMDAGLVCLSPEFDWPSFPSKIFSYVCAGLPIVYRGPPAPALRDILTGTGVGHVLDGRARDIAAPLKAARENFADAQREFLARADLGDRRLDRILGRATGTPPATRRG